MKITATVTIKKIQSEKDLGSLRFLGNGDHLSFSTFPKMIEKGKDLIATSENELAIKMDKVLVSAIAKKIRSHGTEFIHLRFDGKNGGNLLLTFDEQEWKELKKLISDTTD